MRGKIGESIPRVEDKRLLKGLGRYTDDFSLPGTAYGVVLRSPVGHAKIASLDADDARAMDGVLAILTGADADADGLGLLPCLTLAMAPLKHPDGTPTTAPPHKVLATDRVLHVGDPIAFIVAETRAQALDAAEAILVDYEETDAVTGPVAAMADGAPQIWPDVPNNIAFRIALGDRAKVDAAINSAAHVISATIPVTRVAPMPMEPRAALGVYDPSEERFTLYSGTQAPHRTRRIIAEMVFGMPETQLRVVSPDMGGGFGMRSDIYPELVLVLWAARRLGRPVKWTGERTEHFVSDNHGRDAVYTIDLALGDDGTFEAVRVANVTAMGAYLAVSSAISAFAFLAGTACVYRTPAICGEATGVYTNTPAVAPYRGAGRPEAILAIETVIDKAARELGFDRIELRRKNLITKDMLPFQTGLSYKYDSGDFAGNMDKLLAAADYAGFEARRAEAAARGKLRGLGIINAIEAAGGIMTEGADLRFDPSGNLTVALGTHSHGQGHETTFKQMVAEKLGLDFERVRYVQGDTDKVPFGSGTFGSRSVMMGGGALNSAADVIIEKAKQIAAHRLEASVDDIEFSDGAFNVAGTDRSIGLVDVARISYAPFGVPAGMEPGLAAFAAWNDPNPTFPNGCHAAEIEIDPDTGTTRILRYIVVDDVGTVINPLLLKGQMHGGVVQGLSQALQEAMVYEDGSGQPLSGSLMDYQVPRADDLPFIEVEANPDPTPSHPLGVKGAGEAGTVGALACMMAAVTDALAPAGVKDFAMPATPARVWAALRAAKAN